MTPILPPASGDEPVVSPAPLPPVWDDVSPFALAQESVPTSRCDASPPSAEDAIPTPIRPPSP